MTRTLMQTLLNSRRLFYRGLLLCVAAALIFTLATSSTAGPLPLAPGQALFPAPNGPPPGGGILAQLVNVPFATSSYNGTLTSTVLVGDPSNPLGGLTFTYLLQNNVGSPGEIDRLTVSPFNGFATTVEYVAGGGQAPTYIDRSVDSSTVGFSFLQPPVGPGALLPAQTSDLLVIYTNAPTFIPTLANVIDSNVARVASFAPAPEPSTFVLCSLAALGLGLLARRRM
jgi:hypothetical protein